MNIFHNRNLKLLNTFGFDANTKGLICITSENVLLDVIQQGLQPIKILGGGSNILLTGDIDAYILKNEIKGIQIIDEYDDYLLVKTGAGENWHNFVLWCLSHSLGGLENLSLIPGTVGAAPLQNIGAYGIEQESAFHSLQAIDLTTGERKDFSKDDCHFGYRESIFKNESKDQYFITNVTYRLTKKNHVLHIEYGAIKDVLVAKGIESPSIQDVSDAVISIRQSKLPDPKVIGNAGSFFKNPVISSDQFYLLQKKYPNIPFYTQVDSSIKVPAGWLIEQAGFKGVRFGNVGVHSQQALVLVNHGNGSGQEIYNLALQIQAEVKKLFGIQINPEVNIW